MKVEARFNEDFSEFDDDQTHVFIQYKGTDICLDFHCSCGTDGHFDGDFAYALRCAGCGKTFAMPHSIELVEGFSNGSVKDIPKEYGDHRDGSLCWVCNKPATYGTADLVERSLPGGATTYVHEDCIFQETS